MLEKWETTLGRLNGDILPALSSGHLLKPCLGRGTFALGALRAVQVWARCHRQSKPRVSNMGQGVPTTLCITQVWGAWDQKESTCAERQGNGVIGRVA